MASQVLAADPKVICGGAYGTCGLFDPDTGAALTEQRFDLVRKFYEDRATVRIGGRFGFIDTTGDIVIPAQFDLAGPFYQGLAEVFVDGRAGVIDRSGRTIVAPHFYRAIPFTREVVLASTNPSDAKVPSLDQHWGMGIIGVRESRDSGGLLSAIKLQRQGTFRLWHIKNGWVEKPGWLYRLLDKAPAGHLVDIVETDGLGLLAAQEQDAERDDLWGLIDAHGTWRVKPEFKKINRFSEGLAVIQRGEEGLMGAIDTKGQDVIPPLYLKMRNFKNGHTIVHDANGLTRLELRRAHRDARDSSKDIRDFMRVFVLDRKGRRVGDHDLERASLMVYLGYDGPAIARVRVKAGLRGLTADGELIDDPMNGLTGIRCDSGVTGRFVGENIRLFRADGTPLSDLLFKAPLLAAVNPVCEEVFQDAETGAFWILTPQGQLTSMPHPYDAVQSLDVQGLAASRNGKWALVSGDG